MEELKSLMEVYCKELGEAPQLLAVALSARKNLCIHPEVSSNMVGYHGNEILGMGLERKFVICVELLMELEL